MNADDVRVTTASSYDRIVDDFARRNADVPDDFAAFRSEFVSLLRGERRVADLGCGPGRDAAYFCSVGCSLAGVDASPGMAVHARGAGVPVVVADIRQVPVRPASLDGIWSAASLLHVPRADVARTLRGWRALLRADGVLGLSTSLGESEGWEEVPYELSSRPTDVPLRRWFVHHDRDALLELLAGAGFEVLDTRERVSHRRWLQVLARVRASGR